MKRIKTVNGFAIYQAISKRDAENYGCEVGNFNLYLASDIRDYGLSCSYPVFDDVDSLAVALELANGSNFAVAEALADELSDSTIQDMDLVLEIERRLDAGQTVDEVRESYDTEEQCFAEEKPETEYIISAYHVGAGEVGEIGSVYAKDEDDAWMKGYGLAMEAGGYEADSVEVREAEGTVYWFSLDANYEMEHALRCGDEPVPEAVLFAQTPEILRDFRENPQSDWWPVWRNGHFSTEPGRFNSADEAMGEYMTNVAESVYCYVHDC